MSFSITCDNCGSKNVILIATTDLSVIIKCEDCGQMVEDE